LGSVCEASEELGVGVGVFRYHEIFESFQEVESVDAIPELARNSNRTARY